MREKIGLRLSDKLLNPKNLNFLGERERVVAEARKTNETGASTTGPGKKERRRVALTGKLKTLPGFHSKVTLPLPASEYLPSMRGGKVTA